mgnify:CR=1 FL=1
MERGEIERLKHRLHRPDSKVSALSQVLPVSDGSGGNTFRAGNNAQLVELEEELRTLRQQVRTLRREFNDLKKVLGFPVLNPSLEVADSVGSSAR